MKLVIVDIDGVIANVDARFARAEEAKQAFSQHTPGIATIDETQRRVKEATNLYWETVFDPDLVSLDTLIEGADEAIEELEKSYMAIYLTSRPETMRMATYAWLFNHRLSGPRLVMKPSAFQYTKTIVWKAGTVQMLACLFGAEELVFIDDERANIDELEKYRDTLPPLMTAKSLAEALAKLRGESIEEGPDPFSTEI